MKTPPVRFSFSLSPFSLFFPFSFFLGRFGEQTNSSLLFSHFSFPERTRLDKWQENTKRREERSGSTSMTTDIRLSTLSWGKRRIKILPKRQKNRNNCEMSKLILLFFFEVLFAIVSQRTVHAWFFSFFLFLSPPLFSHTTKNLVSSDS